MVENHFIHKEREKFVKQDRHFALHRHDDDFFPFRNSISYSLRNLFRGHHLTFIAGGFALCGAIPGQCDLANVGSREARAGDHDVQPCLEILDPKGFEEALDGEF